MVSARRSWSRSAPQAAAELEELETRWAEEKRLAAEIAGGAAGDRGPRGQRGQGRRSRKTGRGDRRTARHPGRTAADLPGRRCAGHRRDRRELDRHSGRAHAVRRNPHGLASEGGDGAAHRRPAACARNRRAGDLHLARQIDRPAQADRRLSDGRHVRHRQDRNRIDPGRSALWRRAEPDRHQHERVQRGA